MTTDDDLAGKDALFAACAGRRRSLAEFVDGLSEPQLATPSLCSGWDVRTVIAHLVVPLVVSMPRMAASMLRHRGFHGANTAQARTLARRPVTELSRLLRERADSRFTPPGQGPLAPFTDLCVHTADIRVPLGLDHGIAAHEAKISLGLITTSAKFLMPRGRLTDLQLCADDLNMSWGHGTEVHGTAADLLLAALGRTQVTRRLTGPGVERFES